MYLDKRSLEPFKGMRVGRAGRLLQNKVFILDDTSSNVFAKFMLKLIEPIWQLFLLSILL